MKYTIEVDTNEDIVVVNRESYTDLIKENESLLQRQENLYEFYKEKLTKCVLKSFIDGCSEPVLDSLIEETNQKELIIKTSTVEAINILNEMDQLLLPNQKGTIISDLAVGIKVRLLHRARNSKKCEEPQHGENDKEGE
jgi:hypothetical protein